MRIMFVTPPFAGHLNPLASLAGAARDASHECIFFTGAAKAGVLQADGFRVVVPESIEADAMERIANWHRRTSDNPLQTVAQFRANIANLVALGDEFRTCVANERPDLVVADFIAAIVSGPCQDLGISWITTIPTPFALESGSGVPAYLGGWMPRPGWTGRIRDAAGRRLVRSFKRFVYLSHRKRLRPFLPQLYRSDGSEAIYSPQKILGIGLAELEFERDWPPEFEMIGPISDALEDTPPLDLPSARKHVLATLGTHLLWAKPEFIRSICKLAVRFPQWHFVISMGQPEDAGGVDDRIAPNVSLAPYVRYDRDLARFDVAIHHGGAGIANACLSHGVPSLVIPHDYDQFDFAARIVYHGLGIQLPGLCETDAPNALARLADRRNWPNLHLFREAAMAYRPHSRFIEIIEEIAGAGAGGAVRRCGGSPDRTA